MNIFPEQYPAPSKMLRVRRQHETNARSMAGKMTADVLYNWINSSQKHYSESFQKILNGKEIEEFLFQKFGHKKINALDLGGPGNEFFSSLLADGNRLDIPNSYGINLHDSIIEEKFANLHHQGITGDILNKKTYSELEKKLNGEKLDFIVSRMAHGLEHLPHDPFLLFKFFRKYFSLLNKGGVMLVQYPVRHTKILSAWVNYINRNFHKQVSIKIVIPKIEVYDNSNNYPGGECSILIERKDENFVLPGLPTFKNFFKKQ